MGDYSLAFPLSAECGPQNNITDLSQREQLPNFSSMAGKIVDFRHLSRRISKTVQNRVQVKSCY